MAHVAAFDQIAQHTSAFRIGKAKRFGCDFYHLDRIASDRLIGRGLHLGHQPLEKFLAEGCANDVLNLREEGLIVQAPRGIAEVFRYINAFRSAVPAADMIFLQGSVGGNCPVDADQAQDERLDLHHTGADFAIRNRKAHLDHIAFVDFHRQPVRDRFNVHPRFG